MSYRPPRSADDPNEDLTLEPSEPNSGSCLEIESRDRATRRPCFDGNDPRRSFPPPPSRANLDPTSTPTQDSGSEVRMTEERFPRRDFLKVTASTALTFGAGVSAAAQTSASARSPDGAKRHPGSAHHNRPRMQHPGFRFAQSRLLAGAGR